MLERARRVVLLIDYDNLQICAARDTPGRDLQLAPVVQLAQRHGTVILARAYAEWNLSTERLAVYKAGIEPAFAPVLRTESDRSGKSLADTVMVAEGMDMLWTLSPDVVVLATSDKDLIPLVRVAKQRGSFVVVLGSDFTAIPLREMADEHITYKQLITDASGRYATEAGPARQPAALPEPARRRRTERSPREVRPATPATVTPTTPPPTSAPVATPRPEREVAPSPMREPAPAPAREAVPASASSPVVGVPEPVAPVVSGSGDADGQISSRRRRRRGSRRRTERLGLPGDASTLDTEAGEADLEPEAESPDELGTPAAELPDLEAEGVEVVGESPEVLLDADGVEPSALLETEAEPADALVVTELAEPLEPEPAAVQAAPERRRRTRRTRTASTTTPDAEVAPVIEADAVVVGSEVLPPADVVAEAAPVIELTPVEADSPAETDDANGTEQAPVRRTRRRVTRPRAAPSS